MAAEAGISRKCLSKWYGRWQMFGEQGLLDQSSRPGRSPMATSDDIVDAILDLRRREKWGPDRIAAHLKTVGIPVAAATVHRILGRHGMARLRDIDPPTGEIMRGPTRRYEHERCGDMVHVDVKKLGQIPKGGGWAIHGKDSEAGRASKRRGKGTGRVGYTYVHSAVDDYSRLGYSEPLDDEQGHNRCGLVGSGLRVLRRVRDRGHRAVPDRQRLLLPLPRLGPRPGRHRHPAQAHQAYTPRTNGKVERYNGTLLAEWARKRPYDSEADRRAALVDFLNYYNNERPHSSIGYVPPAMRTPKAGFVIPPDETERHTLEVTQDQLDIFRDLYPDL